MGAVGEVNNADTCHNPPPFPFERGGEVNNAHACHHTPTPRAAPSLPYPTPGHGTLTSLARLNLSTTTVPP